MQSFINYIRGFTEYSGDLFPSTQLLFENDKWLGLEFVEY